jgi:PhzF family phenazine biosynthesis protein
VQLPIHKLDAFTDRLFGGNPAGVVILPEWLPDSMLQAIAAENNLPETAFLVRDGDRYGIRWFSPGMEIDLCGHATLASAHVLFEHGHVAGPGVEFRYPKGTLSARKEGNLISMIFPARPPRPLPADERVNRALGRTPAALHEARDLLAVYESRGDVEALSPDMAAIAALPTFATAPGEDCDFVSRFFAPKAGIPEDPVTGSAHCTLVPYWSARLGRRTLHARQVSARGGELFCEDLGETVRLSGRAVEYLVGRITV